MVKKSQPTEIYQLKVTLKYSKPPIWRRLLVPSDIPLNKLHDVFQIAFAWTDSHLHQFIVGEDEYYGEPDPDDYLEIRDEHHYTLKDIAPGAGCKFIYEYDFGDSWEHIVVVEKVLPPDPAQVYPVCIKGRLAAPIEDIGGVWGYYEFLDAMKDPHHPDHASYVEWYGADDIDPDAFDLDLINKSLHSLK
ncbi:MAG TPA: plasmid pRiA4b ORF-3 family protein [Anaerolineae bacterium]|nr:plasmid pRiA4b ORF-3 family protein [Anaerolineae bacterium]HQH37960.1 plasmid pRiA4b ORF-3 family protein [Anaerolineae bacterium]